MVERAICMRALVLKLLPRGVKDAVKTTLAGINRAVVSVFSANGFSASLYYLLLDSSFYREHRATLLGKQAFYKKQLNQQHTSALLRRNTHRLEKGLIMQPRRTVFAEGYILETVEVYQRILQAELFCTQEIRWAFDVLSQYFQLVEDAGRIGKARTLFASLPVPACADKESLSVPYPHHQLPALSVQPEELLALFRRRRSVRWYQPRNVEVDLIARAVEMSALAPSACNRQPFRFDYTVDPTKASEIARLAMGTVGFVDNLQALIVVVGDLSNYPSERDRHVIYIDASLAAMQLMLALETLGLSTCPINWPDVEGLERKMQSALGLAYHERPVMLIATGYADAEGGIPFSQKKGSDLLLKEIL